MASKAKKVRKLKKPTDHITVALKLNISRAEFEHIILDFLTSQEGELPNSRQKLLEAVRGHYTTALVAHRAEGVPEPTDDMKALAGKFGQRFFPELYAQEETA